MNKYTLLALLVFNCFTIYFIYTIQLQMYDFEVTRQRSNCTVHNLIDILSSDDKEVCKYTISCDVDSILRETFYIDYCKVELPGSNIQASNCLTGSQLHFFNNSPSFCQTYLHLILIQVTLILTTIVIDTISLAMVSIKC